MDLYAENILDHYKYPRHHGMLESANAVAADANPLCGDKLEIGVVIENRTIKDACFTGEGCAISLASASMLMEEIIGKRFEEVHGIENEQIYDMLGVPLTAARVKCGLLSLVTVKKALLTFKFVKK